MNRQAVVVGAVLAIAARAKRVVRDDGRSAVVTGAAEGGVGVDQRAVLLGSIGYIGLDEQLAVIAQQATEFVEHPVREHQPLAVALFPPWVGKVHEHPVEASVRPEPR
jgi:hypothetical protein